MSAKESALSISNRAIQIDPQWAPAYAQLARSYHYMASGGKPEFFPKSKAAALKALELDEDCPNRTCRWGSFCINYDGTVVDDISVPWRLRTLISVPGPTSPSCCAQE